MAKQFDSVEVGEKRVRTVQVGGQEYTETPTGTWLNSYGDDVDQDVQSLIEAVVELWEAHQK